MELKHLTSFDHTRIAYSTVGLPQNPALVLINGLGGSTRTWDWIMSYFAPHLRIMTWDYRGLFRSGRPIDLNKMAVADHCKDMELILCAEGMDDVILAGWGTGVQIAVEFYRNHPDRVRALVALGGVPGLPFENILPGIANRIAVFGSSVMMKKAGHLFNKVAGKMGEKQAVPRILHRAGLLGDTLDEQFFKELAGDYSTIDFQAFGQIFRSTSSHDGWKNLAALVVPLLVIVGTRDPFMPVSAARKMEREARDGELMVVKGGTHYLPVELPELVALRMEKFFREKAGLADHLLGASTGLVPEVGSTGDRGAGRAGGNDEVLENGSVQAGIGSVKEG